MADPQQIRASAIETLVLLASKSMQLKYESDVPIANVPVELVCRWFSDLFAETIEWEAWGFSESEGELLRQFTSFYDARVNALPDGGSVSDLQALPEWNEIVDMARSTLRSLGEPVPEGE